MVVGGGIAGMQASLDAAAAGYKVYLVERDISIGGVMAQLDKTFPTNDCSTCLISPKLIEVAQHPDIEILTQAEIEGLEGEAGHFTVTLHREPRYIDAARCNACGNCASACPRKAIEVMHCTYCTYTAADMAGSARMQYPAMVRIIKYLCTGRIDIIHILKGFEAGADAISVGG
jgi:heterodisulfide reductase subunit A-like polyferredoxin